MKTITPVLKKLTYIITSITGRLVRLAAILATMSVSTFKTDVILIYIYIYNIQYNYVVIENIFTHFYKS